MPEASGGFLVTRLDGELGARWLEMPFPLASLIVSPVSGIHRRDMTKTDRAIFSKLVGSGTYR